MLRLFFEGRGKEFSFAPAILPFQILLLASYFSGVWTLASSYVGGRRGMPWGLVLSAAVSTAATLSLCAWWIPLWGLAGAAMASAATAAVTSLVAVGSGLLAMTMMKLPYKGLIYQHLLLACSVTVIMWIMVTLRVQKHENMNIPIRVVYYLLAASAFLIISWTGHLGGQFVYGE